MEKFVVAKTSSLAPWHEEDVYLLDDHLKIIAVADGVTLPDYTQLNPPFGPKIIADIFCQEAVKFIKNNFTALSETILQQAYTTANQAACRYNQSLNQSYEAVAALIVIEKKKIYGSRLTDCGFALLRRNEIIFKTPEFWSWQKTMHKEGYGVIGRVTDPKDQVDLYTLPYNTGDRLMVFSDGFENHFSEQRFIDLFIESSFEKLKHNFLALDEVLAAENPHQFDKERTIVVINL